MHNILVSYNNMKAQSHPDHYRYNLGNFFVAFVAKYNQV